VNRPPAGSVVALILAAGVYLGYIGLCIGMEPLARSRFRVLSKADVAAGASVAQRERGMARMYAWEPYKGYLIVVGAMIVGGTAGAVAFALRRGIRGVLLVLIAMAVFALFATPALLSRMHTESIRTIWSTS
jgi:hypothetical protein